ncbi:stress protein [Bacillus altitudinis]|uniref:stress protein n=1 Tax=Bacillus altitudinis TaxID=293387 RepID=UPI00397B76F5
MKKLSIFIFICLMMLTACSSAASNEKQLTTANIIEAFKSAGLEAEKPSDLKQKEFGNIREEGKRILVPSLGENAGGRIFKFGNETDLQQAKSYYDELDNAGSMFFSHTYSKGNFLLQMNGEMKDSEFEKYKKVMDEEIR